MAINRYDGNNRDLGNVSREEGNISDLRETRRAERGAGLLDQLGEAVSSVAGKVLRSLKDDKELLQQEIDNLKKVEPLLNKAVDNAALELRQANEKLSTLLAQSSEKQNLAETEASLGKRNPAQLESHRATAKAYLIQKGQIDVQLGKPRTETNAPTAQYAEVEKKQAKYDKALDSRVTTLAVAGEKIQNAKNALAQHGDGAIDQEIANKLNEASSILGVSSIDDLAAKVAGKGLAGEVALDEALKRSEPSQEVKTKRGAADLAAEDAVNALFK